MNRYLVVIDLVDERGMFYSRHLRYGGTCAEDAARAALADLCLQAGWTARRITVTPDDRVTVWGVVPVPQWGIKLEV